MCGCETVLFSNPVGVKNISKASLYLVRNYYMHYYISLLKVLLFWESHKILHNLPYGFDIYLVNVKTIRKIAQIFVAFSEKLNFIELE